MARTDIHHEWLQLLDIEEPLLAPPVMRRALGDRLVKTPTHVRQTVLERASDAAADDYTTRLDWITWLLTDVLGHKTAGSKQTLNLDPQVVHTFDAPTGRVTLQPWAAIHNPGKPDEPRMLVLTTPGQILPDKPDEYEPEKRHRGAGWPATPVQRATKLARYVGCRLALITNGRHLTLVGLHDNVIGHGTWHVDLFRPEPIHLDSLIAVLHANRLYGPDNDRPEALLDESLRRQRDLTGDLGDNVRRAAELLVAQLSRANRRNNGRLLDGVPPATVYEAAVVTIMRTVFLLAAEENGLLPSDDPVYRDHYAASTLYEKLEDQLRTGRAAAQRRASGWHRLTALSRAIHQGVDHGELTIPAYGGGMFDPDRFPFLEGRIADPDPDRPIDKDLVDDLTLAEILKAITVVGGRTVSFAALETEQIGHVYESLLDHSAVIAEEPVVGLVGSTRGLEPEVRLSAIEAAADKGDKQLGKLLSDETGKTTSWVRDRLDADLDERVERGLLPACDGDRDLYDRVRPYANLLRVDLRGLPMVFTTGDLYVTETSHKSDTGTAYTSRELADEIAEHALAPLVYSPGPQDTPETDQWELRSSDEILALKVCDPAIGSAAIAVAAVRYLADRLVDAWLGEGEVTPEDLVASSEDTRMLDAQVRARREVVAHCIYGVDVDPMAVEMAKMSLWLETMAMDRPFTFLDHAIKCGNSLLGISDINQLKRVSLAVGAGASQLAMGGLTDGEWSTDEAGQYLETITVSVAEAQSLRRAVRSSDVIDITDANNKAKLHTQAEAAVERLKTAADALVAAHLSTAHKKDKNRDDRVASLLPHLAQLGDDEHLAKMHELATLWKDEAKPPSASPRRFFHWPLEFPEVFAGEGRFDAVVGNPPFLGGHKISVPYGDDYRNHIVAYVAMGDTGVRGKCDLVGYFFRRSAELSSGFGLLATNSVWQGDTRAVALDPITTYAERRIYRAASVAPWPGEAGVSIAKVWWQKRHRWQGPTILDGVPVPAIESDLYPAGDVQGRPMRLPKVAGIAGVGQEVAGKGFNITPAEARRLMDEDPANMQVLFEYRHGAWINASPSTRQEDEEWVINFHQWPLAKAEEFEGPMAIVRREVKPERDRMRNKGRRDKWWQFASYRPKLVERMSSLDYALVMALVSNRVIPLRESAGAVYTHKVVVFPWDDWFVYGLLTSTLHRIWTDRYSSSLGTGISYIPRTTFDTFPHPTRSDDVAHLMQKLDHWRSKVFQEQDVGITELYGRFHDPDCTDMTAEELRRRHREIDEAVLRAYGWSDVALDHGFYDTRYGEFYVAADGARYELLNRLLELNFRQYAEQTGRSYESVVKEARQHG